MKKFLVATAVIASSQAFAQGVIPSIDYSKCQQAIGIMGGPQLNDRGELSPGFGQQANPDVKTTEMENGEVETTYTIKGQSLDLKGKPTEQKYKVRKNKEGHVIEVYTAQDKLDPAMVNMHKQWALNGAVYSGVTQDSLAYDPMVMVSSPKGPNVTGEYTFLSKLSKEQAKQFGVDIDDLRSLKKQMKKDKKTLAKISDGYKKLMDKSHMMLPNGVDAFMEVKDGICRPTKVMQVVHDTKAKQNHVSSVLNQERCDSVLKIQKKYSKQLEACANTNYEMYKEMNPQSGYAQGGYVGGMQGGVNGAGIAGGYPGGIQGGYPMGGGFGMGFGYNNEVAQCQQYFGEMPQGGFGMGGGIVGGAAGGYDSSKKSEVLKQ